MVDQFEPIGLAETVSHASLTERIDRKYLVDPHDVDEILLREVGQGFRVLDIDGKRSFSYESVYFDTPQMDSYLMTARSRPTRFKVRTRSYLDSTTTYLEVKERDRNDFTVKRRLLHPFEDRDRLTPESIAWLAAATSVDGLANRLGPVLTVNYRRSTLVDTNTWSRVTLDTELTACQPGGRRLGADGFAVVETKSVGHPTAFDHHLWGRHYRPTGISKYCTLLAALDPALPANKWNRILRRYFDWEPRRPTAVG